MLPESIGNIGTLLELDLSDNDISLLPESTGNLKSLRRLHLYEIPLTLIPKSIEKLKKQGTVISDLYIRDYLKDSKSEKN